MKSSPVLLRMVTGSKATMRMSVGLDAVRVGLETRAHSGEGIAFADCMLCHTRVDVVSLVWEEGLFQTLLSVG